MSEEAIVKSASCNSLSGRSALTYEICCRNNDVFIRIAGNTGRGIYSKDWVSLSQITQLHEGDEKQITAKKLKITFSGKSVNSVGFVIAALIAEGLLRISENSLRCYERVDAAEYQKILQSYANASPEKKTAKKKAAPNPDMGSDPCST